MLVVAIHIDVSKDRIAIINFPDNLGAHNTFSMFDNPGWRHTYLGIYINPNSNLIFFLRQSCDSPY